MRSTCSRVGLPASLACSLLLRGLDIGRDDSTEKETLLFLLAEVKFGLVRLADILPPLAETVPVDTGTLGRGKIPVLLLTASSNWPGGMAVSPNRACR